MILGVLLLVEVGLPQLPVYSGKRRWFFGQSPSEPGVMSFPFITEPIASPAQPEKAVGQASNVFKHHAFSEQVDECVDHIIFSVRDGCSRFAWVEDVVNF